MLFADTRWREEFGYDFIFEAGAEHIVMVAKDRRRVSGVSLER